MFKKTTAVATLPTRADDRRHIEMEKAIADRYAERQRLSDDLAVVDREMADCDVTKRTFVLGREAERSAAKARYAVLAQQRIALTDRLVELEADIDQEDAARARLRDDIDRAISPVLRAEFQTRATVVDAALAATVTAQAALREVADHAEAQLQHGLGRGCFDFPTNMIAEGRALDDLAERLAQWRKDLTFALGQGR